MSKARAAPLIYRPNGLGVEGKEVPKCSQKTDERVAVGHYGTHKHMSSMGSPEAACREAGHSPVRGQGGPPAKVVTTH